MDAPYDGTEVTVVSEEMEKGFIFAASGTPKKKKKKYKGTGDQGDKAKKPRSAYLLYYYDIYLKVQQELPNLRQSEINKKISESWRLLSVAEKSYYLEKANIEREGQEPNATSTSSTVSDIPGFRKILPRSNYIIIPRSSSHEDSRKHTELRLVQSHSKGADVVYSPISLLREAEQSLLALNPRRAGMTEQCISLEELVDDANSFQETDVVQEVVTSEIFPTYLGAISSKRSGDTILDESDHSNATTNLAVEEEELDHTAAVPTGVMSVVQLKMDDGMSALAVKAEPSESGCTVSSPNEFIVLPVPPRTTSETLTSIKLAATYTRRGRGNCTNSGCSYTYVTRHKPPTCPLCDTYLGGKWIPKEKSRVKSVSSCVNLTKVPAENSIQTETPQLVSVEKSGIGSAEESLAAVSQLLNVVPGGCKTEWEEVNISDALVRQKDSTGKCRPATGTPLPTEATCARNQNIDAYSVSSVVGGHSQPVTASLNVDEIRSKSRPRPALLAAARPIRAIRPAPSCSRRMTLSESLDQKQAFIKNGIHSLIQTTGLKLSTLKQLGHTVQLPTMAEEENIQVVPVTRVPTFPSKLLDVYPEVLPSYKYSCVAAMDLGLATSRGRGKCKNPACSYVYTNRHKPPYCPSCGHNLSKNRVGKITKPQGFTVSTPEMLTIFHSLSQSQKEIQRLSTLQLLRKVVQVPENESELTEVLALIHELNSSRFILSDVSEETVTIEQTSWSNYYESPADECLLCGGPLFKGEKNSLAGPRECWLLTANRLQVVTAQVKMCLNPQCLALHSFIDIYTGLFNLGNKLLVSLDLLFNIRNHIKLGEDPNISVRNVLLSVLEHIEKVLSSEDELLLHELLRNCYWAFECLTVRDYNDMICGLCGIAPKVEIAQRNMENTLSLKNIEFTWPELQGSGEVNVEDFWFTMEMEVIEQAAFPSGIPITKFDAAIIAPFFAPLMRGTVVVNTEKDKNPEQETMAGNCSALVRLLQEGSLKLEQANSYDEGELQHFLTLCDIPFRLSDTKDTLISSLLALHSYVQKGSSTRKTPGQITGGKLYKVCPHQVVCGSKYIVRGENACDHVDLLVSSRHWPPVYVVDIATQVALCADTCYPELTTQMWGQDQGCFSNPMEPPLYVSSPELLDQHYNMDMTVSEPSLLHPITKSTCRRVVHAGGELGKHTDVTTHHRSLLLCQELEPYKAIVSAIHDSKTSMVRQQAIAFDNATHYYLYNRLIDFLTSREIVNRQIHEIVQSCQPGEVVIRDTLYRLGVAQIKTEENMNEEEEIEENLSDHILEPQ